MKTTKILPPRWKGLRKLHFGLLRICSLFLLMVVILPSCVRQQYDPAMGSVDFPEMERTAITFANELCREQGLFFVDGAAGYHDGFDAVCLSFTTQRLLDICHARDLIVYVVEGLIDRINCDECLTSELSVYPFPPEWVEVVIECESFHGVYADPFYVSRIVLKDGIVTYYAFTATDKMQYDWQKRTESYRKAVRFSRYRAINPCHTTPEYVPCEGHWGEEDCYECNHGFMR